MDRQYGDEIILRFPVNLEVKKTISTSTTLHYNILIIKRIKHQSYFRENMYVFFQKHVREFRKTRTYFEKQIMRS